MCQPKYWNKIYTEEVKDTRSTSIVSIVAERSDFEHITIDIILDGNDNLGIIANKIKRGIDALESYRDCDCSSKTGSCLKHLDTLAINTMLGSSAKIEVIIGRRG